MKKQRQSEKTAEFLFINSVVVNFYGIGFITRHYELFPYKLIYNAFIVTKKIIFKQSAIGEKYYFPTQYETSIKTFDLSQIFPGPTLITNIGKDRYMNVKVINSDGTFIHELIIGWFEIWRDREDLAKEEKSKSRPGTHIHGCAILDDGDILVSLRNSNLFFVFDGKDHHLKYKNIGGFVHQHDPDFIDGNSISVCYNHNVRDQNRKNQSRILVHSVPDDHTSIYDVGREAFPFYSVIMGKHQWLPIGNMLITDSIAGRAFEINLEGTIVWEYISIVKDGYIGIVEEATRFSPKFSKDFLKSSLANVPINPSWEYLKRI